MASLNPKDLLLAPRLDAGQAASLLRPYGLKETAKADANLQAMGDDPRARHLLAEILEELLACLARSVDPDQALNYFERFAKASINRIHLFSYLKESPRVLELLAVVFGGSPFMAEILIRDPVFLYWVSDPRILDHERKKRELTRDLADALKHLKTEPKRLDVLRIFKRKEILRIGVRDLLKRTSVEETGAALSVLAEVLIQKAYEISERVMRREHGVPVHAGPSGKRVRTAFTVLAMGKLGGGELNFSSDVDLVYLYASDREGISRGRTSARAGALTKEEYFKRLSQKITSALGDVTPEGYVYRVDLRLRPEGKMGSLAHSLRAFERYYAARGETWERLALTKAWPVAGARSLGMNFLKRVASFIHGRPFDRKARSEVKRIKERIDQKMSVRGQSRRDVKLGFGGIREIEFIVQSLQASFGKRFPKIRERNTLKALRRLRDHGLLSREEHRDLSAAYRFLRDVENKLQMVSDVQTHAIPVESEDVRACALRMGYRDAGPGPDAAVDRFLKDYRDHAGRVHRTFEAVFDASGSSRFR
ncbi:MAG TPA: putative nucleotidyltransferase substrate binding domain-containing protein [Nitrospiria bacterium]|nr:putative nucleotidyltransferase substrate binding domain-containing protein [Nitrospiria bacterium]